jgi:tetratricopeptide (TPR) repeat protein
MRLISLVILTVCASAAPAAADQTDPRLDSLFAELRGGGALGAEETIGRIIDIWSDSQSDTVDLLFQRASVSAEAGDLPLALALLDHVVGLAPHFAQGYALRGAVRLRSGDHAGAVADFSRTIELEPRQFDVRMALAAILEGNGEKREAYDMLQSALEWNPHDPEALRRAEALRERLKGQDI